jgi:hypothetical protein
MLDNRPYVNRHARLPLPVKPGVPEAEITQQWVCFSAGLGAADS